MARRNIGSFCGGRFYSPFYFPASFPFRIPAFPVTSDNASLSLYTFSESQFTANTFRNCGETARQCRIGTKTFMFLLSTEENAEHCSKEHGLPRLLPCIFRLSLPSGTEFKELEVERQSQGAFAFGDCIPNVTNCVHCP